MALNSFQFETQHAIDHGVGEAIFIKYFQYWIEKNKANEQNKHDGRYWTFNSKKAFIPLFPFYTRKKIERIICSLRDQGVLITGNYNKIPYDKTLWYAFKDEQKYIFEHPQFGDTERPKRENGISQKGKPIPSILPSKHISKDILYDALKKASIDNVKKTKIIVDKNLPEQSISDSILNLIKTNYLTLENIKKHRIDKPSKTINSIIKIIHSMKTGEFETYAMKNYNNFNTEFFKKHNLNKILSKKFSDADIITMFNNIDKYFDTNNYPHYNNENVKPGLNTLLFNDRTGTSLALWLFTQEPAPAITEVKALYPSKIELRYKNIAFAEYKFTKQDDMYFKKALNTFFSEMEKKLTYFKNNHYNIKVPDSLYTVHAKWIRDNVTADNYNPSTILSMTNGFWSNFNNYVQKTYNCTLEPSEKSLRQSLKKWEREKEQNRVNKNLSEKSRNEFIQDYCV